ncbi:MAG: hypothetical protein M1826_000196 [Phylliscum demangeonii]|nr:MAG: hypothetical protein M1826_000196 [Phylliscum demangeonii]
MSAAGAPPTPPPDFVVLSRAVGEVATQISRIPQYVASNNLEAMFARLRAEIRADIRAEVQVVSAQVEALRLQFSAERWNAAVRSQNAWIRKSDTPLAPLHNAVTNAPIPTFPSTSAELNAMSREFDSLIPLSRSSTSLIARMRVLEAELGVVLRALDLPVTGNALEKRDRLRTAAGLPTC